jgi:hypothetical protein
MLADRGGTTESFAILGHLLFFFALLEADSPLIMSLLRCSLLGAAKQFRATAVLLYQPPTSKAKQE